MTHHLLIAAAIALQTGEVEDQGWRKYTSKEGNYSVEMLDRPVVERDNLTTPAGEVPMTTVSSTDGVNAYTVMQFDYPKAFAGRNPDTVLNNLRDGAIARGKLLSERKITLDGYPGRDLEYEWPDEEASGGTTHYRERLYLVENRLYRTIFASHKAGTSTPQVERWLNSFKLVFRNGQKPPVSKSWIPPSGPRLIGKTVNAAIPLLGGIYATIIGFRTIGNKPGEDLGSDLRHQRWGKTFRLLGPLLIMLGLFLGVKLIIDL